MGSIIDDNLLSTEAAARLAGVGPSSVKRWADQGILRSVRTAGGHRRYPRDALERFLQARATASAQNSKEALGDPWGARLIAARRHEVEGALLDARARLGAWYLVADEVAQGLVDIGERWAKGEITVEQEHVASDCLVRSLVRVIDALPLRPNAPRCLLVCVEEDEHTLGLALAELCLREQGWGSLWLGRKTPETEIVRTVQEGRVQMVGLSASIASTNATRLARTVQNIGAPCRARGVPFVLGGLGAWPAQPRYGLHIRSFAELERVLASTW